MQRTCSGVCRCYILEIKWKTYHCQNSSKFESKPDIHNIHIHDRTVGTVTSTVCGRVQVVLGAQTSLLWGNKNVSYINNKTWVLLLLRNL